MTDVRMTVAKVVLCVALAGSTAAAASVGGAAAGVPTSVADHRPAGGEGHRVCELARSRLTADARRQHRFREQTAGFVRLEERATSEGDARLSAYWATVVARRTSYSDRQSVRLEDRTTLDARLHRLVDGTCPSGTRAASAGQSVHQRVGQAGEGRGQLG